MGKRCTTLPHGVMYSYTVPLIATGYSENFKYIKGFRKVKFEVMEEDPLVAIKSHSPKFNFSPGSHTVMADRYYGWSRY